MSDQTIHQATDQTTDLRGDVEAAVDALRAELATAENTMARLESDQTDLLARAEEAEAEIDRLRGLIDSASSDIKRAVQSFSGDVEDALRSLS